MKALAGDDDHPAVPGFDPDVSAELYTTNGDVTGDAYNNWGTQAYTVELDGGSGDGVGGTVDGPDSLPPGGFVFQDDETAVQAEFQKNLDFALDLAKSAAKPDQPVSHLGNTAPDFVPTTFSISHGDPQTVEVNAKRSARRRQGVLAGQRRARPARRPRRIRRRRALRQARHLLPSSAGKLAALSRATPSRCGSARATRPRTRSPTR